MYLFPTAALTHYTKYCLIVQEATCPKSRRGQGGFLPETQGASAPASPSFDGCPQPSVLLGLWVHPSELCLHGVRRLFCTRTLDKDSRALWVQDPLKATALPGAHSHCLGQDALVEHHGAFLASPPGGRTLLRHDRSALLF